MTSGGARVRSGPPADPNAIRRGSDPLAGWTRLPAHRDGVAPEWPLSRPNAAETRMWATEWQRPQATQWEANHQELEVALFVRSFLEATSRSASTPLRTLVRQQMDALGLTVPGLRSLRWLIEPERTSQAEELIATRTDDADLPSAKARLKALQGGRS